MTTPETIVDPDRKELLAQLRRQALTLIQGTGGAQKLPEILRRAGDPRLLDIPIDGGAEDYPDSLLEMAIREYELDCARILIESGADPTQSRLGGGSLPVHVLACNAGGMTEETIHGFWDLLGAAGADFDAKDAKGWTPLHYAVHHGFAWTTQHLIQRGVRIDPMLLDPQRESEILPDGDEERRYAMEALRVVRSKLLQDSILSAMPSDGEPTPKALPGMTL